MRRSGRSPTAAPGRQFPPEPRPPTRVAAMVVGASIAAALMAAVCQRTPPAAEPAPPAGPKRVRCAPLAERVGDDVVELRGTIAPPQGRDALVAPQVAGRVVRLLVAEGERVRAGQELARIDDATLGDQVHQTDAVVARAEAETALARTTEARVRRVFDRGIAARQELEDAGARLATARANEAEARAAGAIARRQLGRASVRSPLPGVVLRVLRKPGELVDGTPATPVVEVADPTVLDLVATVTGADLVRIRAGARARVSVSVLPDRVLMGKVPLVSPAVDRVTGLGVVRVRLDAADGAAPPIGVTGTVRVESGTARRRLLAPSAALRAVGAGEATLAICGADGRAQVVTVRVSQPASGDGAGDGLIEVQPPSAPVPGPGQATSGAGGATTAGPTAGARALGPGTLIVVDPILGVEDGDVLERAP